MRTLLMVLVILAATVCIDWADKEDGFKGVRKCTDGEYTCFQTDASTGIINCFPKRGIV